MAKADIHFKVEGKVTGAIKGEANAPEHQGEIEVRAWSWGMTGSSSMGGAGAAVKTALSEFRVTKSVDKASTALMSVMRNNEQIKKAVLSVRKAGVTPPTDYLVITLERGRITSLEVGTETPDDPTLVERLSIAFEKIEVTYAAQDNKGAKTASSSFTAEIN